MAKRDPDLILPDDYLTGPDLDTLWDWFSAKKDTLDPEMIFVKLINSARKPYRERLRASAYPVPESDFAWRGSACYTPSECTVETPPIEGYIDNDLVHNLQTKLADAEKNLDLQHEMIRELEAENLELKKWKAKNEMNHRLEAEKLGLEKLKAENETLRVHLTARSREAATPIRIAIKSAVLPNRFIQIEGSNVKSWRQGGGGSATVQTSIGGSEKFELVCHPGEDGVVSFKSMEFENVYLRADAGDVIAGRNMWCWGGGTVNTQYGCGTLEKFKIQSAGTCGKVAIESVAYPGRYIRVSDGYFSQIVNLQGVRSAWDEFYLVVVA